MTQANEQKNHNGEAKKPELLPTGDKAKGIVEVLLAIYLAMERPEDIANDDMGVKNADH